MWLLGTLCAVCGLAQSTEAEAAYRAGIEALDAEDWSTAADAMTRAIATRPAPGGSRVKIYGMRFEDYVPYFHLGKARERLGDCPAALAAWQRTEISSLGRRRARELEGLREQCRRRADRLDAARNTPPRDEPPAPTDGTSPSPSDETRDASPEVPQVLPSPWVDGPPPEALRAAAADFLARRYGSALHQLRALGPDDIDSPAKQATVHLLKAACHFALWRLDAADSKGEPPPSVADEIRAAKALDANLRPSPFWFSPGFRDLFESL